ncbi:hypothetical protein ACPSKX_04090 [Moritella viscosa]
MSIDKQQEIEKLKQQQQKENDERKKQQEKELNERIEQLDRQEEIEKTLKNILKEEDSSLIELTINALIPWVIENTASINEGNLKDLTKRLGKKSKTTTTKSSNKNYYLVNTITLKEEASDFFKELLADENAVLLEEDNNFAVVYNKVYAGKVRDEAKKLNNIAGDLYRKHSSAVKELPPEHDVDVSKLKKSDFDTYTYKPAK